MFCAFLYCAVVSTVSAKLPPGREEELYCELDHCMREKDPRPKLLGQIELYHECVHREHATVKDVKTWRPDESPEKGYHSRKCNEEQVEAAELRRAGRG